MTAAYSCTKRSIPFILGGDWYENQGSFTEYMNDVYSGSPLFTALKERGYLIDLYEDELYTQDENALSDFDNIIIAKYHVNSWIRLAKQELKLVGFRYAPFDLKRFWWIAAIKGLTPRIITSKEIWKIMKLSWMIRRNALNSSIWWERIHRLYTIQAVISLI